jgi:hypothetical protein
MAKYIHKHGGVGAPVGLTVFKTAEGSLGAVPGGFDSHTPLPRSCTGYYGCVFLPMVLQVLQDYASFSSLQNYASFDPLERPSNTEELRASGIRTRSRPAVSLRESAH